MDSPPPQLSPKSPLLISAQFQQVSFLKFVRKGQTTNPDLDFYVFFFFKSDELTQKQGVDKERSAVQHSLAHTIALHQKDFRIQSYHVSLETRAQPLLATHEPPKRGLTTAFQY
jgi:hypothetical protein